MCTSYTEIILSTQIERSTHTPINEHTHRVCDQVVILNTSNIAIHKSGSF